MTAGRATRAVRTAALMLGLVLATGSATPAGAGSSDSCSMGGGSAEVSRGEVPVLLVHGTNSAPSMWDDKVMNIDQSLPDAVIDGIDGAQAFRFDYRAAALEWVTDDRIGPALTTTLACLAEKSGRKVVVVAHSLGGLATQYALGRSELADGEPHPHVAAVVTLGTPFTGSRALDFVQRARAGGNVLAAVSGNLALAQAIDAVLSECARVGREDLEAGRRNRCDVIAIADLPLGLSLRHGSDAIAKLPRWPDGVPLLSLSGEIEIPALVADLRPGALPEPGALRLPSLAVLQKPVGIGDVPVSVDSATAFDTITEPLRCGVLESMGNAFESECFHSRLQTHPSVVGPVLRAARLAVEEQQPDPGPVAEVDWDNRSYTVDCAGISAAPFISEVRDGTGTGPEDAVDIGYDVQVIDVAVGDLAGDEEPEAVVVVFCAPQGVSPGFFTAELQVFKAGPEQLATLAAPPGPGPSEFGIEPRLQLREPPRIFGGVLTNNVDYWVGADPMAGPSVTLEVTWNWNGRRFDVMSG